MDAKYLLKEDDLDLDIDVELPSKSISELYFIYEENGDDLFSEQGIRMLKDSGLIDEESGFPITEEEDGEPHIMTMEELRDISGDLISSEYIKNLFLNSINGELSNEFEIAIDVDEIDAPGHMSKSFISDCFCGDVLEYFTDSYYDISFSDVCDHSTDISENNKKELSSMGFPENVYELLNNNDEDDLPEFIRENASELKNVFTYACEDAFSYGAERSCLSDFNAAIKNAIPRGCTFKYVDSDKGFMVCNCTIDFVKAHLLDIWDEFNYWSSDYSEVIEKVFIDEFNYDFNFREPGYGWYDFDEEQFNESLEWRLNELKYELKNNKTNEELETTDDIDLDISDELPSVYNFLDEVSAKQLNGLINLHGKRGNVWSLDIHDKDAEVWHSGNVYETGHEELDGYFTFEDAYNKFLNYDLNANESISIVYNPIDTRGELKIVCTRHN